MAKTQAGQFFLGQQFPAGAADESRYSLLAKSSDMPRVSACIMAKKSASPRPVACKPRMVGLDAAALKRAAKQVRQSAQDPCE